MEMVSKNLRVFLCAICGVFAAVGAVAAGRTGFDPELPVYADNAIGPALREEIVRETPARLAACRERMEAQWERAKAEIGEDMECLQFVRILKRMEIARRLFGFAERELARGNTDGLAFAFLATEDLRRFCDTFDEELRIWKDYPLAPGVEPVVIRLADYGAMGDGESDNIAAFDAAIAAARALQGRPAVIEVGEGEFHFSPTTNRVQVLLANLTNVVMRGVSPEKTRLRFDDMDSPGLAIHSCCNTTVSDLELASAETPFFQGVVESFDKAEGWAVVRQHPGTARPDGPRFSNAGDMFCLGIFGPDGNELVDNWHEIFFDNKAEDLGDGRFRVYLKKDHFIYKRDYSRLEPGWQIVIPLRRVFCANAATTGNSRMCNFENIWVRNARECAVSFCTGAAVYSSAWRVKAFPFPGLLAAANADAIMNYRGCFVGECEFDHLNDDGANAHALGRKIMRMEGGDTVIADYLHGSYEAGDPMQVLCGLTGQYLYLGRVKRPGRDLKGGWVHNTQFEEPLPPGIRTIENAGTPTLTEEERRNQLIGGAKPDVNTVPDSLFRPYMFGMGNVVYKTRFSSLRGSGAVLMCPNTLLDEVTYEHMNRGVALTCLPNFGEGPSPYNVLIRNCVFRHCPVGIEGRCMAAGGRKFLTAPVRGLTLENNAFEDVARPMILDNVGEDVEIKGIGAFGAEHQNRLRRKTVFDGSRHSYAVGLVYKFPVRRQSHAPRFAPFVWPDTKASRKDTKPEWQFSSPCLRFSEFSVLGESNGDWRNRFLLVDFRGNFVSVEAGPRSGAAMTWPCAGACPLAQGRVLPLGGAAAPLPKKAFVFRAGGANGNGGYLSQAPAFVYDASIITAFKE